MRLDSGFVTPPGPAVFKLHVANGSKAVNFSNIPVGPSGTAKTEISSIKGHTDL